MPVVVNYSPNSNTEYIVTVMNLTNNTICIPPRAIVSELQPVTIDNSVLEELETETPPPEVLRNVSIGPDLTEEQQQQLINLLKQHKDIFSKSDTDIGNCKVEKHIIDLHDEIPFKERYRRIQPTMIKEVRRHLENLLASGVNRKSNSPWASSVELCRKKNNKIRICVDYRKLNSKTIKDSYAIPRIEHILDRLHGAKYFITVDMKAGYTRLRLRKIIRREQHLL